LCCHLRHQAQTRISFPRTLHYHRNPHQWHCRYPAPSNGLSAALAVTAKLLSHGEAECPILQRLWHMPNAKPGNSYQTCSLKKPNPDPKKPNPETRTNGGASGGVAVPKASLAQAGLFLQGPPNPSNCELPCLPSVVVVFPR